MATRRNEHDRKVSYTTCGRPVRERRRPASLDQPGADRSTLLARDQLNYMHRTGKVETDHYPSREDWHTPGAVKVRNPVEMSAVPPKKMSERMRCPGRRSR